MDSFFGIGAPELIFILILAGIVLGPHRIRDVARWLGKTTAQLQAISRGFTTQLNKELDAMDGSGELKDALREVNDLRRQVAELRHEITRGVSEPMEEARAVLNDSQESLNQVILPPALQAEQENKSAPASNGEGQRPPIKLPKPVKIADDPE